ncbi:class I SAM-dependent methyltransferase [Natronoglycomyces albus]|uniref:Class I SAM-dependent methyltransferase n=1 Tax=Natronoglycomyces albus TaxID=2811108 RepID=A0A895XNM0_9ACTN|nr:class I SAM-dependent methyltransferase [Natronoglycomyces albus]QSB06727.1 class I SAM-dependent methyltransferase [Natronoglycomyces albus]
MNRSFVDLVDEANAVSVDGWDFSWLEGRAWEERPSWGYAWRMARRLATAKAALDIQTGGGEVLNEAETLPKLMVATEGWPPNVEKATRLLSPRGVAVVADEDQPPLPFADNTFDLVLSRHPVTAYWDDIARVLAPGGTYFSQQVGPASVFELTEFFLGPQDDQTRNSRHPDFAVEGAKKAGLDVVDLRSQRLRMEFHDIGAVIYFLRKVIWIVPGFTVEDNLEKLRKLHDRIEADGVFVAHSARFLIEARKPA